MASVNRAEKVQLTTHEGAKATACSFAEQLKRTVMCCMLWESSFYEDGIAVTDRIKDLVTKVNANEVALIAREAKHSQRLRHTPLYLAMLLAKTKEGKKELSSLLNDIITRPDDMTELLALYYQENGKSKPLANQIYRGLKLAIPKFDEYQLAKYNGSKKDVKLRDVIALAHPKPANDNMASLWKRLLENELATPKTWEVELSAKGNKPEVWEDLINSRKLPALATLRNLRNMTNAKVPEEVIKKAISAINSEKLLPMNFIVSAKHNPQWEPLLEEKFLQSFANKPKQSGRTIILVDISGSMDSKISGRSELDRMDAACGLAMIAREVYPECAVYSFTTDLKHVPARKGFALKDAIKNSQPHGSTALIESVNTIFKTQKFDRIIVITDEQAQSPSWNYYNYTLANAINDKCYMINVGTYQNGISYRNGWKHIDGWSDKIIDYIIETEKTND